jgi:hypothetical protein
LFKKLGQDRVARDFSEMKVELARQSNRLGPISARHCRRACALDSAKLIERFQIRPSR